MDEEDKEAEVTGNDKTLIDKILGEMKNQFNKTEKKQVPELLNFTANSDEHFNNENVDVETIVLSTNNTEISVENEICNPKSPIVKTEVDACETTVNGIEELLPSNLNIKEEVGYTKIDGESKAIDEVVLLEDDTQVVKEEIDHQEEIDEKPRIVLTFRKPTSDGIKTKNKSTDGNSGSGRRNLRPQLQILEEKVILKRSPRRRSRDYNESVLQNAIARKEKSYNEASKPQRLTRQLKATPKILENLANAALKLEKNRSDRHRSIKTGEKHKTIEDSDEANNSEENPLQSESEIENDKNYRKHKHRHSKTYRHNAKRSKNSRMELIKDSESDESTSQESKEQEGKFNCNSYDIKNKNLKIRSSTEEKSCRRSHRLSSKIKDEVTNMDDSGELLEPSTAEQNSFYPADPECSSVETQLIASQLCLCTTKNQLYISVSDNDTTYCTAIDNIEDRLVGCSNVINGNAVALLRPSSRVPYIILCDVHLNRMLRHNCCPKCGLFCTQGRFAQCENKHQYHRECQISVGDSECCPHCGLSTPEYDVLITMHSSRKPIFLPMQKPHHPSARMGFQLNKTDIVMEENKTSSTILSPECLDLNVFQTITKAKNYTINELYNAIKEKNYEKLKVIISSHSVQLNTPFEDVDGGTVLHYAAQNGMLSVIHMLVIGGAELDILDKEQNTALVYAILSLNNDIVKYLIKAGASIVLKGTDGMTALHLAAKSGNLIACKLLLDASSGIQNYINMADDGGWTPLVWACEHAHFEVAKFLLHKCADPLLRDVEQNVALHWAAFSGNENIAELLLNNNSDVNAINAHGDTPLHIGARQNMYNCILIFLARGANVNLINKIGESALDCTRPNGDCYNAIMLNVHLQELTTSQEKLNHIILTNDISKGKEINPIQCINTFDDEPKPDDFTYVCTNCITSDDINIDRKITSMQFCTCEEKCVSFKCICFNNSLKCWYDEDGKLILDFNYLDPPIIFECNELCSCNTIICNNRVVQRGLTQRFQLYKTKTKGWGIRTLRSIAKGTFVCEYVGEIVSDVEADRRDDDSYLFDLDNLVCNSFCIDAKQYGNFSRFINHSCNANLVPIRVFIEHHDLRFPRIAFFACKDINAEEELSFDYGEKFWVIKYKSFTCDCGSANCKYSEDTILTTIEKYNKRLQEELV